MTGLLFGIGCGGGTDSSNRATTATGGITLSTTVQDSSSPSTSISVGASVGKSVGVGKGAATGESAPIIRVSKATANTAANGAKCSCTSLDGKVLATATAEASGKTDLTIPEGETQVILKCTLADGGEVTNIVDVDGKKAGETVSVGNTNPETDFIFKQIFKEAGFDNASLASKFTAKTLNPIAMAKTIKEMLADTSVSAGSSSVGASMIAMRNAWRESFANNKPPDFFKNALNGDASTLSAMSGFVGGLDLSTAMKDHLTSFIPACAKTFDDATFKKMEAASAGYSSIAKSFITYKKADMDNIAKNPENFRGLCQNSADKFVAGDANAFNFFKNSNGAALMSNLIGSFDPSAFGGDYEAMQKVLQNYKFSGLGSGDIATHAAAIGNYFVATDNPAERASVLKDPTSIGSTLFNNPAVYAASDGATAAQDIFTIQGNTGGTTGTFTAFTPCSATYPCGAGATCNAQHQCVPAVGGAGACTANCPIGTACSGTICGTGLSCVTGFCVVPTGTTQKFAGETCTSTAQCLPPLSCKLLDVLRCSY